VRSRPWSGQNCEAVSLADALAHLSEARLQELQCAIAAVPAPPFAEGERAAFVAELWRGAGLPVEADGEGNLLAPRPGAREPWLVVSAHLDTVFPPGTDPGVASAGELCPHCGEPVPPGELHGPGIADCAAGLAALTAVAEALQASGTETAAHLLFLATVGEEGAGNLRGVRSFMASEWAERAGAFVTVDVGRPATLVTDFVAVWRGEVIVTGPGGHAWDQYGMPNPILVLGEALLAVEEAWPPSGAPRSAWNVGLIEGGTSVNAIPEQVRCAVEFRSLDARLAQEGPEQLRTAVEARAAARGLRSQVIVRGERPAARTARDHPLVLAAIDALAAEGLRIAYGTGSLDANVPAAAGVPSIGFPWGGQALATHSTRERHRIEGRLAHVRALLRLLATFRP